MAAIFNSFFSHISCITQQEENLMISILTCGKVIVKSEILNPDFQIKCDICKIKIFNIARSTMA